MKSGIELITEERKRQIEVQKWSAQHDADHTKGEIALAAGCYVMTPTYKKEVKEGSESPAKWPWESRWWKPTPKNRIKELVKAGALIAAEIDRLQTK